MGLSITKKVFLTITAVAVIAVSACAVTMPLSGTATPNGRFIYVPDQANNRIRVVDSMLAFGGVDISSDASSAAVIQNVSVPGDPSSMVVNSAGTYLFAVIAADAGPWNSYVRAYSIDTNIVSPTYGQLSLAGTFTIPDLYSSPMGCALSPSENRLYVADSWPFAGGTRLRVINVTTPATMSQDTYLSVSGMNMNLYGVAVKAGRLYVSVNHSTNGQVLVYNIAAENAPVAMPGSTITGCVQASFMVMSADGRLFVRVLEDSSPWTDVKVFNTVADANTLVANVHIPDPGNHQITGIVSTTDGYAAPGNNDYDASNYNAGLGISPDGKFLVFDHYIGQSGYGFNWHPNVKVMFADMSNLANCWDNSTRGGIHSADSIVFTSRNKVWLMYSDGGYVQSTFYYGPGWVDHHSVTSREATVIWGPTSYVSAVDIQYNKVGVAPTILSIPPTTEYRFSGATMLTPMSTYEVRVRMVAPNGETSLWTPNPDWGQDPHRFYTLEQVWLGTYNAGSKEVMIAFGPLIFQVLKNVQNAASYQLAYKINTDSAWNTVSVSTTSTADASKLNLLTYQLAGLTTNRTYQVRMRSVDSSGGVSDWSDIKTFRTVRAPAWITNFSTTTTSTCLTWEGLASILSYDVSYGTNPDASGTLTSATPASANYIGPTTGGPISSPPLTGRTWYHTKVRANYSGYSSDWSPIKDFFTIPAPNNVDWIGATATTVTLTWEPVDMGGVMCSSYEVSWGVSYDAAGSGEVMTTNPFVTISGLVTNQLYYVKIRARDDANSGWSEWAPFDPFTGFNSIAVMPTINPVVTRVSAGLGVTSGYRGTTVIIKGMNFGVATGTLLFGGTTAQEGYWKNNEIAVSVPPTAAYTSNSVTVRNSGGVTALHIGYQAPFSFTVIQGKFILDDMEGGVWHYTTPAAPTGIYGSQYAVPVPERNTYVTAEFTGVNPSERFTGLSSYGNLATENGYDLSKYNAVKFMVRNDGAKTIEAWFSLVESNMSAGNTAVNSEKWNYNVPVTVEVGSGWKQITLPLPLSGTNNFVRDPAFNGGNVLDVSMIKAYEIYTTGTAANNPKMYSLDFVYATGEVIPIPVPSRNIFITREGDAVGSNIRITWEALAGNVDVWTKTMTFETDPAKWTKMCSNLSVTQTIDASVAAKVGSGTHKWYKIMPVGATLTTQDLTQEVLGKFDISCAAASSTLISLPVIPHASDINYVIGNQLTGAASQLLADKLLVYNGAGYTTYWLKNTGIWQAGAAPAAVNILPDAAYWISIGSSNPAKIISIVGQIPKTSRSIAITGAGTNTLVGSSFPMKVTLNSSNLSASGATAATMQLMAAKVQKYNGSGYDTAWLNSAAGNTWYTGAAATTITLNPGEGYWVYQPAAGSAYTWNYTKPY